MKNKRIDHKLDGRNGVANRPTVHTDNDGHERSTNRVVEREGVQKRMKISLGDSSTSIQNVIPRERQQNGDVIARKIAYSHPITGAHDLDEMQLPAFLDEVAKTDTLVANLLRSIQQDRIRQQYIAVQKTRLEENANLEALRKHSREINHKTDQIIRQIIAKRDRKCAPYEKQVDTSARMVAEAHVRSAGLFARAGAAYDSGNPSGDTVLNIERRTDAEGAAELGLPSDKGITESCLLPKVLSWVSTVVSGAVFGISLALSSGLLQSAHVMVQPKPLAILTAIIIGSGLAFLGRAWLRTAWTMFAESHWLSDTRVRQISWFFAALLSTIAAGAVLVTTDRQGILKVAAANSAWSQDTVQSSSMVFWIIAAAAPIFYLGCSIFEGLFFGRQDAIRNLITRYIESDYRSRLEQRMANPEVQDAMDGLNLVTSSIREAAEAARRLEGVRRPFNELIEVAEAQQIQYPLEYTDEMKRRIDDARDNLEGAQIEVCESFVPHVRRRLIGAGACTAHLRCDLDGS